MQKKFIKENLWLLALASLFLPYIILSFSTYPIAEDFGFAFRFQQSESFLALLKNTFFKMNGRYFANIFMYASPTSINSVFLYQFYPIFLILMLTLANLLLFKAINLFQETKHNIIFSLVFTVLYLHNLPIISEGLYWQTGSSIYMLGIVFCSFFLFFLVKTINHSKNKFYLLFTFFSLFVVSGFNEVLTILLLVFLCALCILFYTNNKKSKKIVLALLIAAFAFSLIMILAPGNSFRENMYDGTNKFFNSSAMSILQVGRFLFNWILSLPLLIASILFILAINKFGLTKLPYNSIKINKWFALSFLPLTIFCCVFPPYWFTGILGQHRTLNIAYYFFLIAWFFNLIIWSSWLKKRNYKRVLASKYLIYGLLLSLAFTGNGYNALEDLLTGTAADFKHQMSKRINVLDNASKDQPQTLKLKPITAKPKTLFVTDISKDPNFWTNQGYNQYFRLKSTKIYIE